MPPDFLKNKKSFASSCKPEETKVLKDTCDKFYVKSTKKGDKDTIGYGFCCETLKVCPPSDNSGSSPFYSQTWFFAVCGGVGLLLIGVIAAVVYFFCIRKKKGGGKSGGGMKSSKKGKTSKTSKSKSEALF
ncbi:hypothetical protein B9Z55_008040 [Caenorhabditis nigoni]|uniref:Uncharacterized protein n=1 Tax=Caenorhabditis nigoni TaxID=1611254 RepID=A0A2G5VCG0_9PELO|nr:hypothetical protein B9Z55_008040 [Caenorhabditis nigoni]